MRADGIIGSVAALRRKFRAIASIAADGGATESERANAQVLKKRLEQRLREAGFPADDWTDKAFRLGRLAKEIRKSESRPPAEGDWTDHARSLGKAARQVYKKWSSE